MRQFCEGGRRTAGKTDLYPLGYGGIGLYPDATYMNRSADAVTYLDIDKRLFHNGDAAPFKITHLPESISFKTFLQESEK